MTRVGSYQYWGTVIIAPCRVFRKPGGGVPKAAPLAFVVQYARRTARVSQFYDSSHEAHLERLTGFLTMVVPCLPTLVASEVFEAQRR